MEKDGLELEITELKLGLPGGSSGSVTNNNNNSNSKVLNRNDKKRVLEEVSETENGDRKNKMKNLVVGWPPVCSYRKKINFNENQGTKMYIKVSMDGAPYLRKIDLSMYKGYLDFGVGLEKLFGFFGISEGSEFSEIYEDKDGDWMLVGDVPWEMFIETCKRLRIMKKSEAKGFGIAEGD